MQLSVFYNFAFYHLQQLLLHRAILIIIILNMENTDGINIFFEEKNTETFNQLNDKDLLLPESLPYLQKGDSSKYIDQFFAKPQQSSPPQIQQKPQKIKQSQISGKDEEFSVSATAKFPPSSFHNFQKHLSVCLKNTVQIHPNQEIIPSFQEAAARLWKYFKSSHISTKKVLHYLLGELNEHKITEAGLKEFGLHKIYQQYDQKTMKEARGYLASETLRQIKEGKLSHYIESKKLKDKQKFKKYVEIFVQQLEQGFLKKRLPKDKVYELQRC